MKKINVDLTNCFGIKRMKEQFDFSQKNVMIVYAPNGTMKSSLAKTFECIQNKKPVEEKAYHYKSEFKITDENKNDLLPENILVVNAYEQDAPQNIGLLMASDKLRKQYVLIHKDINSSKEELFKKVKEILKFSSHSRENIEELLLRDWGYTNKKIFECLNDVSTYISNPAKSIQLKQTELDYKLLFDTKVLNMLNSPEVSLQLKEYVEKYQELVNQSPYMQTGVIDFNNYSIIGEALNKNKFFKAKNEVILKDKNTGESKNLTTRADLDALINKEKERVLQTKELQDLFGKINELITKNAQVSKFKEFLQSHEEITNELNDIQEFKKKIWSNAFSEFKDEFSALLNKMKNAQATLKQLGEQASGEKTLWNKVIELFTTRFSVPFKIETSNKVDVILNEEMPSFEYVFENEQDKSTLNKTELLEILSTGERRAYYILNIIYNILLAEKENKSKIIIFDDVSESFDYRNKHAIIEYIKDVSLLKNVAGEKMFNVLLLTHNYDFYRTVASRLGISNNSYIAYVNNGEVKLKKAQYTRNPFAFFKTKVLQGDEKFILCSVPFVRNLIEYTYGKDKEEYLQITHLLHYNEEVTPKITYKNLLAIYEKFWTMEKKIELATEKENLAVYNELFSTADGIPNVEVPNLENKIILSMAIRLKAEKIMTDKMKESNEVTDEDLNQALNQKNQTAHLISLYKEKMDDDNGKSILEEVSMITPENIHINSFMFEPILDMSICHLYELYGKVKMWSEE